MKNSIQIYKDKIDDIPVMFCYKNTEGKKIPILLLHKLMEDKESELMIACFLAEHDYFVVVPDLLYHGEHEDGYRYSNKLDFNKLFTELDSSMYLIQSIIDYLKTEWSEDIKIDSFGIVGSSYGGMLALTAGYRLHDIKVVAGIITSANWQELVDSGSFEVFRMFSLKRPVVSANQVKDYISEYDPLYHLEQYNNKPVLLMNGSFDTTFTYKLVQPFYESLAKQYSKNGVIENLVWQKYPKVGHKVNYTMTMDLIKWLDKVYERK